MARKNIKTPSFYTVTPATVRYDKSLNPYARLLYGELTALSEKEGYAWATNNYLASLYQVDRSSISHWIKQLQDKGHIRIEFIYDKTHCYVEERRIYITGLALEKPSFDAEAPHENTEIFEEMNNYAKNCMNTEGGGDIYHHGGDVCNQGVVTDITRGGYKAPQRSLQEINTRSSSSDPPEIKKPPPEEEDEIFEKANNYSEDINSLKQVLKELNSSFVFSESFYRKAVDFLALKCLDPGYVHWLYGFCLKQAPRSIENYFFKVFFDDRLAELYLEQSRPPPVKIFKCPVCSTEHDINFSSCPKCRLDISYRLDNDKIFRAKRLYEMPEGVKKAYNEELNDIFNSSLDFDKRMDQIKSIELKYGLSP